jgi:PAS domain S-box-containing protein
MPGVPAAGEPPSGHAFPRGGVFNAAVDAVVIIAADGFVIDWNPAAERMFGYARDEALGRELADLIIPEEFQGAHRQALARWRGDGEPEATILGRRLELHGCRSDRTSFPIELTVSRIGEARPPLFVGFLRDLSAAEPASGAA